MMGVIWPFSAVPTTENRDQAKKNHLFFKTVNIYNLYFLMMVHLFFSLWGSAQGDGDCGGPEEVEELFSSDTI